MYTDLIGGCNITLSDCNDSLKRFKMDLLHHGLPAGRIEGTVQLFELSEGEGVA